MGDLGSVNSNYLKGGLSIGLVVGSASLAILPSLVHIPALHMSIYTVVLSTLAITITPLMLVLASSAILFLVGLICLISLAINSKKHSSQIEEQIEYLDDEIERSEEELPIHQFYCSYFVASLYLKVEAFEIWEKYLEQNIEVSESFFQVLNEIAETNSPKKRKNLIKKHAIELAKSHGEILQEAVDVFRLNPKIGPSDLARHLYERPDQFTKTLSIVPPGN